MFKKILICCLFLLPFFSYSQKFISYRDVVSDGYNFLVYTPSDYDSVNCKPVIIFLHGNSLCGTDLSRVKRYGPLDALEMGRKIEAVVIAPQNGGGAWQPQRIMNVLTWVKANYAIDSNRVYVIGMSLGAYGTIQFVGTYPEKIAAAMALCGGGNLNSYCGLNEVPLWILHGSADKAVAFSQSQKVVDNMISCGDTSRLRFTKLHGMNHSQLARIFYLNETYEWLLSHSLTDSLRPVNRMVNINESSLNNAYQNFATKPTINSVNGVSGKQENLTPDNSIKYYTIKKGDTLSSIARKYHTTVLKLCKLNKIKETTILKIGRKIKVK